MTDNLQAKYDKVCKELEENKKYMPSPDYIEKYPQLVEFHNEYSSQGDGFWLEPLKEPAGAGSRRQGPRSKEISAAYDKVRFALINWSVLHGADHYAGFVWMHGPFETDFDRWKQKKLSQAIT